MLLSDLIKFFQNSCRDFWSECIKVCLLLAANFCCRKSNVASLGLANASLGLANTTFAFQRLVRPMQAQSDQGHHFSTFFLKKMYRWMVRRWSCERSKDFIVYFFKSGCSASRLGSNRPMSTRCIFLQGLSHIYFEHPNAIGIHSTYSI